MDERDKTVSSMAGLQHLLQDIEEHCSQLIAEENLHTNNSYCPRVFDQLWCWAPTLAGQISVISCPHYISDFNHEAKATKTCGPDGAWLGGDSNSSVGWSNYSSCLSSSKFTDRDQFPFMEWLPTVRTISMIGYSLSLSTLIISFIILSSFRKLKCPRNKIHLHLFGSFILRATVVLLRFLLTLESLITDSSKKSSYVSRANEEIQYTDQANSINSTALVSKIWCKTLTVVWQYFILANYSWIFMEGLYLHNLIFKAMFTDSSAITIYILLGWGLPLGCVGIWSLVKALLDDDDQHCWMMDSDAWITVLCIKVPVIISNCINFFLFINIIRVLFVKMKSLMSPEYVKYRKLGKSTLVLVPLFGVPYFLLYGLSTFKNTYAELTWLFLDQIFASFQGFMVSVLYCLSNGEVQQELRKFQQQCCHKDMLHNDNDSFEVRHNQKTNLDEDHEVNNT